MNPQTIISKSKLLYKFDLDRNANFTLMESNDDLKSGNSIFIQFWPVFVSPPIITMIVVV
jgi:hypothetical protein